MTVMSYIRKRKRNGYTYLEEVESIRVNGKVKQKYIRYIGKEVDNKTILSASISNISIEQIKLYGPLLVLNYIAKKIGLLDILGSYGKELMSLVYAHCINYKSINHMSKWFKRTDLNFILNLENVTEDKLLKALDSITELNYENLQKKIFARVKKEYSLDTKGIVYDVTNTYLYGKKCSLGKLGKDKEGIKGRPLIQIGLGVTKKEGIPIFHKTFDGNISDSRTLKDLITSFYNYDIKSGFLVYDRGIVSADNIKESKKSGWETICGLPSNNRLKAIVKKITSENKLFDIRKRIKINKTIFYVFSQEYSINGIRGKLLVCYNEQKRKDLRESRYDEILNAKQLLINGKTIKIGLEKYFNKNNGLNHTAITKSEEYDGFSFVFSTKRIPINEIIKLYFRDKDIVEKAFQSLKGIVRIQPIRHWLYNRVTGHVFICYLSYLLLSLLKLSLEKLSMSSNEALDELSSLYKVYIRDKKKGFKLAKTVALTKKQENILKSIDKNLLSCCSG